MSATGALHELSERVQADLAVALERACASLPRELDTYATRKIVARRLLRLARSGEERLSELTTAARHAVAEMKPR